MKHTGAEQIELGAPVILTFDQLEPGNVALDRTAAPRPGQRSPDCGFMRATRRAAGGGGAAWPGIAAITGSASR